MNVSEETIHELLTEEINNLCHIFEKKGIDDEIFYVCLIKHVVYKLKDKMFNEHEILNFVGSAFIKHIP